MYKIAASINGRYEQREFEQISEAIAVADEWRQVASTPVRFKRDGVSITDADELDRLVAQEAEAEAART